MRTTGTSSSSFGLLLVLLTACSTPSVPISPPKVDIAALTFSSPAAGEVVLKGKPSVEAASALFYILDTNTGEGVIATAAADGSFTAPPLAAAVGDTAEIFFDKPDGTRSDRSCVGVLLDSPLVGFECP